MDHLFDMRPERPGYRLHRLEVFNWGTFDSPNGQIYRFEPEGRTSLLVGHNGSGKSTLVDAILTLLVEPRIRNYNVAAGSLKTERNEKSYIRGAYGRTGDELQAIIKYLRPQGTHLTAIAATFRDEQLGQSFTLCQVLYLEGDSWDKVYAISDGMRDLKTDLADIRSSDAVRIQLQRLGYEVTKTFTQYHGWLLKRTKMRAKATDIFNQTVAVKEIQSLNDFIRSHMLETHDWREKVQRVLTHFNDLSVAHQELLRARKMEELLVPVEQRGLKYREMLQELQDHERMLAAADLFVLEETIRLFQPEIKAHELKLADLVSHIDRLKDEAETLSTKIRQLENARDDAGGARLREIPALIILEEQSLRFKNKAYDSYHERLALCGISEKVETEDSFASARVRVQAIAASTEQELATITNAHNDLIGRRGQLLSRLRDERTELELLNQRQTNLPPRLAMLRSRLCSDLQLGEDDVPFAAELIAVDSSERRWEASAEMLLKPFALSLLVPDRYYRRVCTYVDHNKLTDDRGEGQRLDYIRVGVTAELPGDRVHPQSLVRKLRFRERHPLAPWVRGEIQRRFDFRCCETVEEFNEAGRFAMTEHRHIKIGNDRHQKDDRTKTVDPRFFILGWDNREKKRLIALNMQKLAGETATLEQQIKEEFGRMEGLRAVREAVHGVLAIPQFDDIDIHRHQTNLDSLEAEKKRLKNSNNKVKALQKSLDETQLEYQGLQQQLEDNYAEKALLSKDINDAKGLVKRSEDSLGAAKQSGSYAAQSPSFEEIRAAIGAPPLSAVNLFQRTEEWTKTTRSAVDHLRGPLQEQTRKLLEAMNRFLRDFKEEQTDLSGSVESLDSFVGLLEQVRQEDLPRHEKKFKDRLNDKVSQEIALFNGALRNECKQIESKIRLLNEALGHLDYQPGMTYMQLELRNIQDPEIEEFRRSLRECLDESLENSPEANEARFERIRALVERLGDKEKSRWRDKVIDVRNWCGFAAREIEKDGGGTRSYHEGSSGQSGGEKSKLAFTILVAAIAYQYDLDPTGATPGRFHFVVVDEMFSKVDDQNAQYALRLFEQFGLQLLIVAPLDAKACVTEPFVDCYLHTVKNETTNRSQIYSMTAQEYDDVVKAFAGNGKADKSVRASAK